MTPLSLRRVDAAAAALRQAVAQWRAAGMAVDFHDAAAVAQAAKTRNGAPCIAFHAGGADGAPDWDGLVRCDEWLAYAAPALAGLALPDGAAQAALALFSATPRPLSATFPYRKLTTAGLVSAGDFPEAPLALLHATEAKVWLRALPAPAQADAAIPAAIAGALHDLPVTLQFLLGASRLSRGRLSGVAPGDVLLVADHALGMRCNGLVLGWYSINEKGITVDKKLDEPYEDLADAALQAAPEEERALQGGAQDGMARIPVRLEFVLQQNKMTVGELAGLHGGQVFDLAPDAEKSVLVLANGALLGRGELVQLEDRLGVEMIDIYGGGERAD
ncbi:YscQ/HrcQ family type III secretion apparatus protein [Oxalobacteraceae bacterium CAVE-383]|nr:YscQ/HrcQ family type III secretion apparatus protein [Oxalobacteraceae bacterium CAVE-383]